MITEAQLLAQLKGIDRSLDSIRKAILLLSGQNLELLAILRDIQLERRPGIDLSILIEARREHEKHRPA